jgi:hypothetical protein
MSERTGAEQPEEPDEVTDEMIARRAHEISQSEEGRSDEENWLRAERELRGTQEPGPDESERAAEET